MRTLLSFLVLTMLLFAVGGGSSGETGRVDYDLTTSVSCPGNELVVSVTAGGNPVEFMTVEAKFKGSSIGFKQTGEDGIVRFVIRASGNYYLSASKSGYKTRNTTVSATACEETGANATAVVCDQATRTERAKCILGLSNKQRGEVNYLPEECREQNETGKQRCVATYRLFQTCRSLETDEERSACIKPKLNISSDIRGILQQCQNKTGTERAGCVQQIRTNVLSLVKFRMYNLEYKAGEFLELGISEDQVIDIIAKIDEAKIAFNDAETIREKIAVIKQLKQEWQAFVAEARKQLEAAE